MSLANEEIDRIVREVVRRLATANSNGDDQQPASSDDSASCVLQERLVTLDTLERQLPLQVDRLSVPRGAVITPSARDLLRAKGVELCRHATTASCAPVAIARIGDTNASCWKPLTDLRAARPLGGQTACSVIQEIRGGIHSNEFTLAVVLAEHPQAVACLCNRHARIRAAIAVNAADVTAVRQTLDANVLVLDGKSTTNNTRDLAERFLASGPRGRLSQYQEQANY